VASSSETFQRAKLLHLLSFDGTVTCVALFCLPSGFANTTVAVSYLVNLAMLLTETSERSICCSAHLDSCRHLGPVVGCLNTGTSCQTNCPGTVNYVGQYVSCLILFLYIRNCERQDLLNAKFRHPLNEKLLQFQAITHTNKITFLSIHPRAISGLPNSSCLS
jgi:hypothetical protein